jgi:methyltransferase, FkbM family
MTPNDLVQRRIEVQYELAIPTWIAFYEAMKGCKVVMDIGANVGGLFLSFIGNGATQVHAFEPVPIEYAKLVANFGKDSRLIPSMVAMSDVPGRVVGASIYNAWTLMPKGDHIHNGYKVDETVDFKDLPTFDFDLTTVDLYCSSSNIKPDFLKIDVDGYELRVLKGAVRTISERRPPILFELAFHPSLIGDNCEEMCKLIFDLGYVVVTMDYKTVVRDWLSLIERFPWRSSFDVMLMPKERV